VKDPDAAVVAAAFEELVPAERYGAPSIFENADAEWRAKYDPSRPRQSGMQYQLLRHWSLTPHSIERRQLRSDATAIIAMLTEALKNKNPAARGEAIKAFGRIGPEAAAVVPHLVRVFETGDREDRDLVVRALWAMRVTGSEVEPLLWQTLREDDRWVTRFYVFRALVLQDELDPKVGVPVLVTRFKQGIEDEKGAAAILLSRFGPDAAAAADVLRESRTQGPKDELQVAIDLALRAIAPHEESDREPDSGSTPWWLK
jgi:hypothetical protein